MRSIKQKPMKYVLKSKKTIIVLSLVIFLLASGSIYAINHAKNQDKPSRDPTEEKFDLNPATETEREETEAHKDALIKQGAQSRSEQIPSLSLTITDANYYDSEGVVEVRAYVSGVYEETGVCTFTFIKDSETVTKDTSGTKSATTTNCTTLTVPRTEFQNSGNWQLIASYSSPSGQARTATTVRIN